MNPRAISITQLIAAGFFWSTAGIFIKLIDANPLTIVSFRSLVTAAMLLVFLRGKPRFVFSKPQLIGALCNAGTMLLFVVANKTTTAANAILLQYGAPVYVVFMSYFILREKIRWYDYAATGGVAVGMIIFFSDALSGGGMFGNILAVLSGVTFAGQAVCLRLQKGRSQFETVLLGNSLAFLVGLPFLIFAPPVLNDLLPLALLGVFQLGLPYILFAMASRNATALDLILIPIIEPLLNPVWVFIGTGEKPSAASVLGGAIVLSMVVFKSYFSIKQAHDSSPS